MADKVLLSASLQNINDCIALATERGLGIEVMAFAYPEILDGDWQQTVKDYQALLAPVPGDITLHGPFLDMVSGSPDPRISAVCQTRYTHAIRIEVS